MFMYYMYMFICSCHPMFGRSGKRGHNSLTQHNGHLTSYAHLQVRVKQNSKQKKSDKNMTGAAITISC